jgi:hypothetical protein
MEPMNCVIQRTPTACEVWNGEQFQTVDQGALAAMFGLKPEKVKSSHAVCRRQLRPARQQGGLHPIEAASIVKAISGRGAGQAGLDARGRHEGRLLPAHVPPHARSGTLDGRQHPAGVTAWWGSPSPRARPSRPA